VVRRYVGTKSEGEREDEEADRLVRPAPKQKPPRRDLRRERVETDRDSDVKGDADLKGDPDMSLNYKTVGGSAARIAALFLARGKDPEFRRFVDNKTFRSQETGEDVRFESLPNDQQAEIRNRFNKDRDDEETKAKGSYKPLDDGAARAAGKSLADLAESNPQFASVLEMVRDPASPLGGAVLAEANRHKPLASLLKGVTFPDGVKTVGDLQQAIAHVPRKGKAPKKPAPTPAQAPVAPPAVAPPAGAAVPAPGAPPVPGQAPTPGAPAAPGGPVQAPPAAPPAPVKKPPAKPEIPLPKRPDPTARETYEARQALLAALPPDVAVSFFTAHPEDVRSLLANYRAIQDHGVASSKNLTSAVEDVRKAGFKTDFESVKPPTKAKAKDGSMVPFEDLPAEEQAEALQKHRVETVALGLAVRGALTSALSRRGAPKAFASSLAELCLSAPSEAKAREKKVREASEKAFFATIEEPSAREDALEKEGEKDVEEDERFGTSASASEAPDPRTKASSRRDLLAYLGKVFPDGASVAAARFQGEDYLAARETYLSSASPDQITEHDPPADITRKVQAAVRAMRQSQEGLPSGPVPPAWKIFRDRVLRRLQALDPSKHAEVERSLQGLDREQYELDVKAYDKAKKAYDEGQKAYEEALETHKKKGGKEPAPPPLPPVPPVEPFDGSGVDAKRVLEEFRNRLASRISTYRSRIEDPGTRTVPLARSKTISKAQGVRMSTQRISHEEAKKLVDAALTRLDGLANGIQAKFACMGLDEASAKAVVNGLDKAADAIESAFYGTDSLVERQVEALKQAKVLQRESDEPYMATFDSPMAVHQQESDEPYMSAYNDDQSAAVINGKANNGRPLAP
jgi:hypothetical protein